MDPQTFAEFDADLEPLDPLKFKDRLKYEERVKESQQRTQTKEAMVSGRGTIRA